MPKHDDWREHMTKEDLLLLEAWAARYADATSEQAVDRRDVCIFERATTRYAIELTALREIRTLLGFSPVPGARPVLAGLFYYSGQIITLHDLQGMRAPEGSIRAGSSAVIVECGNSRLGLWADDVVGVMSVDWSKVLPLPVTVGTYGQCFAGMLRDKTLVLAPDAMLEFSGFNELF